jgi:hypothetical protein
MVACQTLISVLHRSTHQAVHRFGRQPACGVAGSPADGGVQQCPRVAEVSAADQHHAPARARAVRRHHLRHTANGKQLCCRPGMAVNPAWAGDNLAIKGPLQADTRHALSGPRCEKATGVTSPWVHADCCPVQNQSCFWVLASR